MACPKCGLPEELCVCETIAKEARKIRVYTVQKRYGKNITVISEVVAMRHLLRYSGVDSARQFNDRLIARMQGQRAIREYLEEDYE